MFYKLYSSIISHFDKRDKESFGILYFALRFREMPASCRFVNTQKPDVALLIKLQKIGLGNIITDFSISLCSTTWFITSFRSCCIAYFKDKSAKKLSRRKIETDFFPAIFSWFTNIAYAILRDLILSLELHNQIVIDAWH